MLSSKSLTGRISDLPGEEQERRCQPSIPLGNTGVRFIDFKLWNERRRIQQGDAPTERRQRHLDLGALWPAARR